MVGSDKIREGASVGKDIGQLFKNDSFSDVTLVVNGQRFPVHKAILATRSEYFRIFFLVDMKESFEKEVKIEEPYTSFERLLKFICTGEMDLDSSDEDDSLEMLRLADKYLLSDLQKSISDHLQSRLTLRNCCKVYHSMQYFSASQIDSVKRNCMQLVDKNPKKILGLDGILNFDVDTLKEMIGRNSFKAIQPAVFKFIQKWIEANGQENGVKLLSVVHLRLMPIEFLVNTVRSSGLFSEKDILDAISVVEAPKRMKFDAHNPDEFMEIFRAKSRKVQDLKMRMEKDAIVETVELSTIQPEQVKAADIDFECTRMNVDFESLDWDLAAETNLTSSLPIVNASLPGPWYANPNYWSESRVIVKAILLEAIRLSGRSIEDGGEYCLLSKVPLEKLAWWSKSRWTNPKVPLDPNGRWVHLTGQAGYVIVPTDMMEAANASLEDNASGSTPRASPANTASSEDSDDSASDESGSTPHASRLPPIIIYESKFDADSFDSSHLRVVSSAAMFCDDDDYDCDAYAVCTNSFAWSLYKINTKRKKFWQLSYRMNQRLFSEFRIFDGNDLCERLHACDEFIGAYFETWQCF